jgi:hypothetical protein
MMRGRSQAKAIIKLQSTEDRGKKKWGIKMLFAYTHTNGS